MEGLADEVNQIVDRRLADRAVRGTSPVPSPVRSYAAALANQAAKTTSVSPEKRKDENYWRCRRALRLRPIGQGNAVERVEEFMREHLGLSDLFIQSVGPFTVQRLPFGPEACIKGEAIVTFQSTDVRDAVKGAARNLAGKGRDYGVRLELPNHLKSAMKALQAASYELKSKYPQARRNVLFDDETQDLVLDFCLGKGKDWKRITGCAEEEKKVG